MDNPLHTTARRQRAGHTGDKTGPAKGFNAKPPTGDPTYSYVLIDQEVRSQSVVDADRAYGIIVVILAAAIKG